MNAPVKAPPVAEQFGLDQLLGQRRAVDLDEGSLGTGAVGVHRIGNQFLARAVVTEYQDVGVAAGHRADQFVELEHLLALPHDRREATRRLELPAKLPVLDAEPHAFGRALEFLDQLVWLDRTADDREGAGTQPVGSLDVSLASPHDDGVGIGQLVPPVTKGFGPSGRTGAGSHQQDVRGPHFDGEFDVAGSGLAQFDRPPFVQPIQPDPDRRFHLAHEQQPQHPFTCHVFLPDRPALSGCPAIRRKLSGFHASRPQA